MSHNKRNGGGAQGGSKLPRNEFDKIGKALFERFKTEWITDKFMYATTIHAGDFAKYLKDGKLSRTQVRNFFEELRRIERGGVEKFAEHIRFLPHKLGYVKSRWEGKDNVVPQAYAFEQILRKAVLAIPEDAQAAAIPFSRFVAYFEAVLAYHRYHGGKD